MAGQKGTTVRLRSKAHRALNVKAATSNRSVSELTEAVVVEALREDALDLEAFAKRSREPSLPFEKVLRGLKRDGRL